MGRGYLNPSGMGMRFDFSSPFDMGRVMGKYLRVEYGERKVKLIPTPFHYHA